MQLSPICYENVKFRKIKQKNVIKKIIVPIHKDLFQNVELAIQPNNNNTIINVNPSQAEKTGENKNR